MVISSLNPIQIPLSITKNKTKIQTAAFVCIVGVILVTPFKTQANEIGVYLANDLFLDFTTRKQGLKGIFYNAYYHELSTDEFLNVDGVGKETLTFTSYGVGTGYNWSGSIRKLNVFFGLGYGISYGQSKNTKSENQSAGMMLQLTANYDLKEWMHLPISANIKFTSLPTWTSANSNQKYGGNTFNMGGSIYF